MRKPKDRTKKKVLLRKGDTVVVLSGEEAGKRGVVQEVDPFAERLRVDGVNIITRHRRPRSRAAVAQQQTGRIQMPGPLHVSNVMLVCPRCERPTRPRRQAVMMGEREVKVRVCRRCGEYIDEPTV